MSRERIVVTGVGIVSPIGNGVEAFWQACLRGVSGAHTLDSEWVRETGVGTRFAATIRDFDPVAAGIPAREVKTLDRTTWFALAAAREAVVDAGFALTPHPERRGVETLDGVDPDRIATIVGSGIGGLETIESSHAIWRERRSVKPIKRYSLPMLIPNAPSGQVAIHFGARGENKAICTACATGTMAIGDAWRILRDGEADVVLAGGAEGSAGDEDAYGLMGFDRLRTLSRRNDAPEKASRPFDRDRDGFVFGEGAGVVVLERESHARARGARPYAVVAGYGSNCDAVSMMQLDETGAGIVSLIRATLERAGISAADVDHVNAHGTSTIQNDRTESRVIHEVFGGRAGDVRVTALKSMTGHAIAGSGAMETIALARTLRDGVITPTINYETPDPECDVHLVANRPVEYRPRSAVKLSYGFGGHNACLLLTPV